MCSRMVGRFVIRLGYGFHRFDGRAAAPLSTVRIVRVSIFSVREQSKKPSFTSYDSENISVPGAVGHLNPARSAKGLEQGITY